MLKIVLLFLISMYCVAALSDEEIQSQWQDFKKNFNRQYDGEEEPKRFQLFSENLKKITAHNEKYEKGEVTFKMGINDFADKTTEEIKKHSFGVLPKPRA